MADEVKRRLEDFAVPMSSPPLELDTFSSKVANVAKVLENEGTEVFVKKKSNLKRIFQRLKSIPCCDVCDSCLKRFKLRVKVLLFLIGVVAGVFFFYNLPLFFSAIYSFLAGI
jgi:hypothetical protein